MERALAYERLFILGKGADVTFVLPDGEVLAHKSILMAQLPFFERMFSFDMIEARTNRVKVTDFKAHHFMKFLKFIYSGLLRDPFDLEPMLILANKYDVPSMMNTCLKKVKTESELSKVDMYELPVEKLTVFTEYFRLANRLGIVEFKQGCEDLFDDIESVLGEIVEKASTSYRGSPVGCRATSQRVKDRHGVILSNVVEILVLAHRFSRKKLKQKCLSHLTRHKCDLDQKCFRKKLKDHPEVLLEIVSSYHMRMKNLKPAKEDSDDSDKSADSDGSNDSDES